MVKTLNIAGICCPVRLFRRNNCCFLNEKISQSETENDKKKTKFSNFQSFYAIFVKYSTDFVDWIVEKSTWNEFVVQ